MAEEKELFSKKAVVAAIRLAAQGAAGVLNRKEAEKVIESLPENLAEIAMEETVMALKAQAARKAQQMSKVLGMLAQGLMDDSKEN